MMYLSKVSLRTDTPLAAIAPVLLPDNENERIGVAHRLIWLLFGDHADRRTDFLWRELKKNQFIILSERMPQDPHAMFHLEIKAFDVRFAAGQRLRFSLRINPTIASKHPGQRHGRRESVITRALRDARAVHGELKPEIRDETIHAAMLKWLKQQGDSIFTVDVDDDDNDVMEVVTERVVEIARRRGAPVQFSAVDVTGTLIVVDPVAFSEKLKTGYGRAKSFGCGLMLVMPAR